MQLRGLLFQVENHISAADGIGNDRRAYGVKVGQEDKDGNVLPSSDEILNGVSIAAWVMIDDIGDPSDKNPLSDDKRRIAHRFLDTARNDGGGVEKRSIPIESDQVKLARGRRRYFGHG